MASTAKLSSIGIIFLMSSLCGVILPYLVLRFLRRKYRKSTEMLNNVLSILNCFSGGVFFSTSILALLPEAREQVEEAGLKLIDNNNYPTAELFLGFGFLIILIIENVTISCHRNRSKTDSNQYDIAKKEQSTKNDQSGQVIVTSFSQATSHMNDVNDISTESQKDEQNTNKEKYGDEMTNLRNIVMLLALSIHMVFDGLELGLLDKENKVWSVLLALGVHKILILFGMGLKMCESTTFVKFAVAMVYLSLVSPAGVGIGIFLTSQGENLTILQTSAILQSLAVGTFIYVAFFEILLKEFISSEGNRIFKTSATVFGFALFAVVSYLMPD
ncbi:zinc transporter ZIP1-like [Mercenaria mercenaria]|uniref:zinc transporter ZIP1-like n=1 Tax=Mercenaria mercenaria TaxID=6596 RepID=UPI00234E445F|nr:zinc transporter ZIP1-like [Mercenaria mercenaria]